MEAQHEDVAAVIFDMIDGVGGETSKKIRSEVLVPALAALAVFVRRNDKLMAKFSRGGETEKRCSAFFEVKNRPSLESRRRACSLSKRITNSCKHCTDRA